MSMVAPKMLPSCTSFGMLVCARDHNVVWDTAHRTGSATDMRRSCCQTMKPAGLVLTEPLVLLKIKGLGGTAELECIPSQALCLRSLHPAASVFSQQSLSKPWAASNHSPRVRMPREMPRHTAGCVPWSGTAPSRPAGRTFGGPRSGGRRGRCTAWWDPTGVRGMPGIFA